MLRQRSIQGTIMDVEAPVTGIPMGMENGAATGNPGQLVFLPDLPSTVQLWHNQRLIMVAWLLSSLISLVLFAPLFMASGLFLAAEIAAVMGVIASVVQLCEKELASSNSKSHKLPRFWPTVPGACTKLTYAPVLAATDAPALSSVCMQCEQQLLYTQC
jgi:hypothetical protein